LAIYYLSVKAVSRSKAAAREDSAGLRFWRPSVGITG